MVHEPTFLIAAPDESAVGRVYSPEGANRRAEAMAWLTAAACALGTALLSRNLGRISGWALGLTVFLGLVAVLISYGNWMDRQTTISVERDGIRYMSPLRKARLTWSAIEALLAEPGAGGWRITVTGGTTHFSFRTSSAYRVGSVQELGFGFRKGEVIAATIKQQAGLGQPRRLNGSWECRGQA